MRFTRNIASALFLATSLAVAIPVSAAPFTIYNTGVDNSNTTLPLGSIDSHWTVNGASAFVPTTIPTVWIPESATSTWLSPTSDASHSPSGLYVYTTTFSLAGLNPGTATINGRFTSDNSTVDFLINGVPLNINSPALNFDKWTPFSITNGFIAGSNTLSVQVNNSSDLAPNPTAFRLEITSANASASAPEPSAALLILPGLALAGIALRRKANM
jgi:hypothetical protein